MISAQLAKDTFVYPCMLKMNRISSSQIWAEFISALSRKSISDLSTFPCGSVIHAEERFFVSCRGNELANLSKILMKKVMSSTPKKLERLKNQVREMTRKRRNHVVACNRTDTISNMSSLRTMLLLPPKCQVSLLPLLAPNIVSYIFTLLLLLLLLLSLDTWGFYCYCCNWYFMACVLNLLIPN